MQIDGLIPFKSSIDQVMDFLYFMIIPISFYSLSLVKSVAIITSFDLSTPKKAYFRCLHNSLRINPSKLFSISYTFSLLLLDFSALSSFKLNTVSFNSKLAFRYYVPRSSIY